MLIIAGLIMAIFKNNLGIIGNSAYIVSFINPHILLYVFIPVLIFEGAFNCDWYTFKRSLINILILAAPGVLIGAVIYCYLNFNKSLYIFSMNNKLDIIILNCINMV